MNDATRYSLAGQRLFSPKPFDVRGVRRIKDIEFLRFQPSKGKIAGFVIHHALLQNEITSHLLNYLSGIRTMNAHYQTRVTKLTLVSEVQYQLPGAKPSIVDFSRTSPTGGDIPVLVLPIKEQEIFDQIVNAEKGGCWRSRE